MSYIFIPEILPNLFFSLPKSLSHWKVSLSSSSTSSAFWHQDKNTSIFFSLFFSSMSHRDGTTAVLSICTAELSTHTYDLKWSLDDLGFIPASPPLSDCIIFYIKILRNGVSNAFSKPWPAEDIYISERIPYVVLGNYLSFCSMVGQTFFFQSTSTFAT